MEKFHISATGHSLNYLPQYVADWQGYFAEEGLEISVTVPSPWQKVLTELGRHEAQAVIGGIWVPSMYHGRGRSFRPFAQMSNRAPLALLGRADAAPFDWSALAGKWILMKGSNGASVGVYMKMMLRENGIDPKEVNFIQDLDASILTDCFLGGMGDYLMIDAPSAQNLETRGKGRIAQLFSVTGGDIPWSVYYAEGTADTGTLDTHRRFCRALDRGMDFVLENAASGYRDFLHRTFPKFEAEDLVILTDTYRKIGMWTGTEINPAAYARWQGGIHQAGLTEAPIPYDDLVDTRPTRHTTRTLPA